MCHKSKLKQIKNQFDLFFFYFLPALPDCPPYLADFFSKYKIGS